MTDETRQPDAAPEPEQKRKRATNAELEQRVTKVVELLVSGLTRAQIFRYVQDKTDWQIEDRQLDTYIQKATEQLKTLAKIDREAAFGEAIAGTRLILAKALQMQDFQRALAARKELHTLQGLYPAAKSELKIEGLDLFHTLAERARAAGVDLSALLTALMEEIGGNDHV